MKKRIKALFVLFTFVTMLMTSSIAYAESCLSVRDYGQHMYREWYYRSGQPYVYGITPVGNGTLCIVTWRQDKCGVCICGAYAKVGFYEWTELGPLDN